MLNNDNGIDINKEEAVRYYKINSNEGDAQTLHKIIIMYYFSYSNKPYNIISIVLEFYAGVLILYQ